MLFKRLIHVLSFQRYPEPDTQVMVQVKQIQENGAYVKLVSETYHSSRRRHCRLADMSSRSFPQLEYDNVEGMILLSELSRRRIRSIQKLIRVGRNEVVMVMRIDKEKGETTFLFGLSSKSCVCCRC